MFVHTLGAEVQRGLGLFCLLGEERNAQIKHSEQDASRGKERREREREEEENTREVDRGEER